MRAFDAQVTMWDEKLEILIIIVLVIIFKKILLEPRKCMNVTTHICNITTKYVSFAHILLNEKSNPKGCVIDPRSKFQ
jgi:hypothetical protein